MRKIPPNQVRSHAEFDLTPLGMWASNRDAAKLMPDARHVQHLPNPFLSNGLGEVRGSGRSAYSTRRHDKPA
jgi:hypothetical protein